MTAITTRPPLSDSTDNVAGQAAPVDSLLRFALRADATLTGLFGLGVAAAGSVSTLTGLTAGQAFALGAALVVYGLVVYSLAALPSLHAVGVGVAIANVVCTAAAVAVVLVAPSLTQAGVLTLLATAVYTAVFAWLQYLGVRRLA